MKSHNTSIQDNSGMTMIEIVVVIGIITILFSLGFFVDLSTYSRYSHRSEVDVIVSVLEKARSQSMNNKCFGSCTDGKTHGVYITSGQYVIFQGNDYASRDLAVDEITTANPNSSATGFTEVVFEQLTGKLKPQISPMDSELTLTVTQEGKTSKIHINNQGRINW